jgi:hypothetical protein
VSPKFVLKIIAVAIAAWDTAGNGAMKMPMRPR